MKIKEQGISILIVAMSLATAWAIRGQFGHEQGAAWAGAIGGLALVMVSQRKDWYNKMILIALASAIGWGAGGMISYGMVVGYGRADNFTNAFYGLSMLFVIGALFGLLGGGLVGLVLSDTKKEKVKWGSLITEMVVGGIISYYFLIEQIGFKMTPPRSEAWAIILGAALAMLLYMARTERNTAIRVAIFSALGGGFGFSFGNFLQILGDVIEIQFNMWNVMEYSIGFFGGLGMAYGVFSSKWEIEDVKPKKWVNQIALFIIIVFIPSIIFRESLTYKHFLKRLGEISNPEFASFSTIFTAVILIIMAIVIFWRLKNRSYKKNEITFFFFIYLITYVLISYTVTGLFEGKMALNHHLYVLNILLIFLMVRKEKLAIFDTVSNKINSKKWFTYFLVILIFIAILSLITINIHDELGGSHNRFSVN